MLDSNALNITPKLHLFEQLSSESVARLSELAVPLQLQQGEALFVQGDVGDAMYIIEAGAIEISTMNNDGKKLTLNVLREQDIFGEVAAIDGGERTASATALEPTKVRRIARNDIVELISNDPQVANDMIGVLCERVRWISQQVEDFGLHGIESRMAHRLLLLDKKLAQSSGLISLSQNELADFLGTSRESVNKILQKWAAEKWIELSRGSIQIVARSAISKIAGAPD